MAKAILEMWAAASFPSIRPRGHATNTNTNANTNTVVESTGSVGAGTAGKGLGVVEAAQHVVASAQNYHRKVTIGFAFFLLTFVASAQNYHRKVHACLVLRDHSLLKSIMEKSQSALLFLL